MVKGLVGKEYGIARYLGTERFCIAANRVVVVVIVTVVIRAVFYRSFFLFAADAGCGRYEVPIFVFYL